MPDGEGAKGLKVVSIDTGETKLKVAHANPIQTVATDGDVVAAGDGEEAAGDDEAAHRTAEGWDAPRRALQQPHQLEGRQQLEPAALDALAALGLLRGAAGAG